MATKKKKSRGKAIQFQVSWSGLIAIVVSCVCVLLWTFVLGFWMGQKVITGNSNEPQVSVYKPNVKDKHAQDIKFGEPKQDIALNSEKDESAIKELTALKKSLKEEASAQEETIKTEVLPEAGHTKTSNEASKEKEEVKAKKESATAVASSKKKETVQKAKEAKKEIVKKKSDKKLKTEKIAQSLKSESQQFALQIASYRTMAQAEKEAARWKKKGYIVRIKAADLGKKGVWYRVYLGRYSSLEEAKKASVALASKEGIRSYVTKVSK